MPIINPWIFYLINISDNILFCGMVCFVISMCVILIACFESCVNHKPFNEFKTAKKCIVSLIISICIMMFVPSSDTIYKMILAENVTYERVEQVGETVEDIYNDILNVIDKGDNNDSKQ